MAETTQPEGSSPSGIVFRSGHLYLHHTRPKRLLRYIAATPDDQWLFKVVPLNWTSEVSEVVLFKRKEALRLYASEQLHPHREIIRRDFMNWSDSDLLMKFESSRRGIDQLKNEAWLEHRDADYDSIRDLVREEALAATYAPETQNAILRELTGGDVVRTQHLKRVLHRYATFGLDKNALLRLDSGKGHMDEGLVRTFKSKPGRPNALVRLAPHLREHYGGRAITKQDLAKFVLALQLFYVGKDVSYKECYGLMVKHVYVQKTKDAEGLVVLYPIAKRKIPSFWAFEKRAAQLVRLLKLHSLKAGRKDGKELEERRGYDSDISPKSGDIFDIDATTFNKESVAQFKLHGGPLNIGRQTVLVVRARGSGKAMGWHCYTGFENWEEGYRLAVFCALTSKKRQLEWLEIDAPDAWPDEENIKPLAVFADNGAGASKDARAAYDRLDIRFYAAAPDAPEQKGGEESLIGRVEKAQSREPGGLRRTSRARDRDAKRLARLMACETQWEIERKLVLSLIKENAELSKERLLTADMRKEGVMGSANEIHTYWIRKMGGVEARRLTQEEVYQALLSHPDCEVTVDGVSISSSRYNSDALRRYRRMNKGKLNIRVMYHPLRPEEAAWITPDGALDRLSREANGFTRWGRLSTREIELLGILHEAQSILDEDIPRKERKKGKLSVRQANVLLEESAAKPKRQRRRPTENMEQIRRIQLELERTTRPFDKPEIHAPQFGTSDTPRLPGMEKLVKPSKTADLEALQTVRKVAPTAPVSPAAALAQALKRAQAEEAAPTHSQSPLPAPEQPPATPASAPRPAPATVALPTAPSPAPPPASPSTSASPQAGRLQSAEFWLREDDE